MYRPFVFASIFFILGIILGNWFTTALPFFLLAVVGLFGIFLSGDSRAKRVFAALAILHMGAFYLSVFVDRNAGNVMKLAENVHTVVGVVEGEPRVLEDRIYYIVSTVHYLEDEVYREVSGKIRLTVPKDDATEVCRYRDVVRFTGTIKIPQVKRNPGGMDFRAYLAQKGIGAICFAEKIEKIGQKRANPFVKTAYNLRKEMVSFFYEHLPKDVSPLLSGIVLGNTDNISRETLELFSNTGLSHLLAVSGLHMGIIYGALSLCLDALSVSKESTFVIGFGFLLFYCFMAGLSSSAMRAAITITILLLGRAVGKKADSLNSIGIAAMVLLILNPMSLFSVSFQLSFSATLGIILFYEDIESCLQMIPDVLREAVAVVVSAQVAVLPFLAYYFNKVSIMGLLANLLVVPWTGVILVLGFLSGVIGIVNPTLGGLLVKAPGTLLEILNFIVVKVGGLPMSIALVPSLPIWCYFGYCIALFAAIKGSLWLSKSSRLMISFTLIVAMSISVALENTGYEVTFIDVGQGDCIFLRSPEGLTAVVDAGGVPRYYDGNYDTGENIVLPFLRSRGINAIDVAVVTHFDDDHARGFLSILENMEVGTLLYGLPSESIVFDEIMETAQRRGVMICQVNRGDEIFLGEMVFKVLGPCKDSIASTENDRSVVMKVNLPFISFLLTGDLEIQGERELMATGVGLTSTVLKVGHHGSKSSTSKEFLTSVSPTIAVIPVGKENRFGHPNPDVLSRLERGRIKVLRTDRHGAITFKVWGENVKIYTSISEEF